MNIYELIVGEHELDYLGTHIMTYRNHLHDKIDDFLKEVAELNSGSANTDNPTEPNSSVCNFNVELTCNRLQNMSHIICKVTRRLYEN